MTRRATTARPYLTTGQCAELLGVHIRYVQAEINEQRLEADIVEPVEGGRKQRRIRIYPLQLRAYCQRYWPTVLSRLPPAA